MLKHLGGYGNVNTKEEACLQGELSYLAAKEALDKLQKQAAPPPIATTPAFRSHRNY